MWKDGRITGDTLYWREGMPEWAAISSLMPPPLPKMPPTPKPPIPTIRRTPQDTGSATGYIDQYLMPGENVVYRTSVHWAIFLPGLSFLIFANFLFFTFNRVAAIFGVWVLVLCVFPLAINAFLERFTSEFAVTNKRVLIKTGWLRRQSLETLLNKVETIRVDQDIFGRMLDYGTIVISGTGGSKEPFRRIDPLCNSAAKFRNRLQKARL